MIVYISIGNSDDKLTQFGWAQYVSEVDALLDVSRSDIPAVIGAWMQRHGSWRSPSDDPWQNACWCVEFDVRVVPDLHVVRHMLSKVAGKYGQDSIAWAEVSETQFLGPDTP